MTEQTAACDPEALERYWLGEVDPATAETVEEHLFACDECARWLQDLASLQTELAELLRRGRLLAATTDSVLARAAERGVRIRDYRIPPGGTIHCTIAPDDDANVVRLAGAFPAERRVDVRITRFEDGEVVSTTRTEDVPVDRSSGEIVLLNPGEAIRALPLSTFHVDVLESIEGSDTSRARGDEHLLGRYTLEHSPWPPQPDSSETEPA